MKRLVLFAVLAALGFAPAGAAAAPSLDLDVRHYLTEGVPQGGNAQYSVAVSNVGDAATSGQVTVEITVPADLTITAATDLFAVRANIPYSRAWNCVIAPGGDSASCTGPELLKSGSPPPGPRPINPGTEACEGLTEQAEGCRVVFTVHADESLASGQVIAPEVQACDGGAPACTQASDPTVVLPPSAFGVNNWDGISLRQYEWDDDTLLETGDLATQAGSHPALTATSFSITTAITRAGQGQELPVERLKDAIVDVPPGLVGNPQAVPQCQVAEMQNDGEDCPPETQVGNVWLRWSETEVSNSVASSNPGETYVKGTALQLYNMVPPPGMPALLGFHYASVPAFIVPELRTDNYGLTMRSLNTNETEDFRDFTVEVWGVPSDPSHDELRGACLSALGGISGKKCPSAEAESPKAFLSLPTSCTGPVRWDITARGWLGGEDSASFLSHDNGEPPTPVGYEGCADVPFDPSLKARPTTDVADSPTGLDVELQIPQEDIDDPDKLAQAHLRHAEVELPEGLAVNPSGANGLGACSESQIDLDGKGAPDCPDASKIGTVKVDTPVLGHTLPGALYLAEPHENPFGSLIAMYLVVDDPKSGIVVKLAGEVEVDPGSGQLTTRFRENPQLPFEALRIQIPGGALAPLRTPPACGDYETTAELTPWSAPDSGPPTTPSDPWRIDAAPSAGCAGSEGELPHSPGFDGGTVHPIAASYSPFVVNLRRSDGEQRFSGVTLNPPPGLLAKLAGTPACSEADLAAAAAKQGKEEQADPSCPAASRIGTVHVSAGAGPSPFWAEGKVYLSGPYEGAPLSLAIITPAVAGPFDLGTVVIRNALYLDPATAQITAVSDQIPERLSGIPVDLRSASVRIDKPKFTRNGTSCNPLAFTGRLISTLGQGAALNSRFQLGECRRLGFKPKTRIRLFGGIRRGAYQGVRAVVRPRPGDANISRTVVRFPRSAFIAQEHLKNICTRVQFAADACPKGSVYGRAIAHSPLLDYPLRGPVYLRSSDNTLPDVVAALRGPAHQPLRVEVAIRNDSVKGALRNTVVAAPDAPVSYFRLQLFGKNKGLIVNSRNICRGKNQAVVAMRAQNSRRSLERVPVFNRRCKVLKRKMRAKRRGAKHGGKRHRKAAHRGG